MKLLAIDTSTDACSAALAIAGEIRERLELAPRRHAELILPMIDQLLSEAGLRVHDLDGLAFGRGPGAFTGLRIAAGVIQGIALGTGLSVAPVSTLAALAQQGYLNTRLPNILASLDARMGEVYWGAFRVNEQGLVRPLQPECVCSPENAPVPEDDWLGVGPGWAVYAEVLTRRLAGRLVAVEPDFYPRAREVAILGLDIFNRGETVVAEGAVPIYLRDQVVAAVPKLNQGNR
jgi:tRNA threonylcarbamoyladenosine biosynthesis protein TsaB